MSGGFDKYLSRRKIAAGRKRDALVKREANGRAQRDHGPDRGTDELQARREKVTGDARRPIDIEDPIDVLHRGQVKHLSDLQAEAASIWRRSSRVVASGGPVLAQFREPSGEGREITELEFRRAIHSLGKIDTALMGVGMAVLQEARSVVIHKQAPKRLDDLRAGLDAIVSALSLK